MSELWTEPSCEMVFISIILDALSRDRISIILNALSRDKVCLMPSPGTVFLWRSSRTRA